MFKWLKPLLFGIWGLLLIPLIGTTLDKWLAENVFSEPNAAAQLISDHLVAVSELRWFKFALVFMTGSGHRRFLGNVSEKVRRTESLRAAKPRLQISQSFR